MATKDKILVRGCWTKNGKFLVPRQARRIVLHLAHGKGHGGLNATTRALSKFWWPKMKEHIKRWVRGCKCSGAKMTRRPDGLNKVFDDYRALQAIVVDYMVDTLEHTRDSSNPRYILMIVDRATGYSRLAVTRSRSAADTAMAIKKNWVQDFSGLDVEARFLCTVPEDRWRNGGESNSGRRIEDQVCISGRRDTSGQLAHRVMDQRLGVGSECRRRKQRVERFREVVWSSTKNSTPYGYPPVHLNERI